MAPLLDDTFCMPEELASAPEVLYVFSDEAGGHTDLMSVIAGLGERYTSGALALVRFQSTADVGRFAYLWLTVAPLLRDGASVADILRTLDVAERRLLEPPD